MRAQKKTVDLYSILSIGSQAVENALRSGSRKYSLECIFTRKSEVGPGVRWGVGPLFANRIRHSDCLKVAKILFLRRVGRVWARKKEMATTGGDPQSMPTLRL